MEFRVAEVRTAELRPGEFCLAEVRPAEVYTAFAVLRAPFVPDRRKTPTSRNPPLCPPAVRIPGGRTFSVAAPPAADHQPQRPQRPNGADDVVKGSARRMRRQPGRSPLSAGT